MRDRQRRALAPRVALRVIHINHHLIELLQVMIKLPTDDVNHAIQFGDRMLISRYRQRSSLSPQGVAVPSPFRQIQHEMIRRIGITVLHQPGDVVQFVTQPSKPATSTATRQQRPSRVPIQLQVEIPDLRDDVIFDLTSGFIFHASCKPEAIAVSDQVDMGHTARAVLQLGPGPIRRIENIDSSA